jgi:hypothetical protein
MTTNLGENPKPDFVDNVATGMPMSKRELLDVFLAHFPKSIEGTILAAFPNLHYAPDDATITFERRNLRGVDCLCGEIKRSDGSRHGSIRVNAVSGQPVQRIG